MATYARIVNGVVMELFTPPAGIPITACFNAALTWVECDATPGVAQGWLYSGGVFSAPPAPPPPTLAQQAAVASVSGLTIALSGTLTLAATLFPTDAAAQSKVASVMLTVTRTGAFAGGATSFPMVDASGVWHPFTVAQYSTVAEAIDAYVTTCDLIANGNPLGATALPSSSVALTV